MNACEHCWDHHEGPCVASVRSERDALAARLAEVEAERDEAWKFAQERIEKQNVETGKRVDLIHEREAFRAERDRLAQELEAKARESRMWAVKAGEHTKERNEAIGHLRYADDATNGYGTSPEAKEFLARFPSEGDEG